MRTIIRFALGAAAMVGFAGAAHAQTVTAFGSFNGTNGNGGFSYGTFANDIFTQFTQTTNCVIGNTICLQGGNSTVPGAYKTANGMASQSGTVNVPSDSLILHPGDGNVQTYARYTAANTGAYSYSGALTHQDDSPTGVTFTPFTTVNGNTTFGTTTSFSANQSTFLFGSTTQSVFNAGDSFGFLIGNAGSYFNDSTGFNVSVAGAVPESATWAMMIIGFGAVGSVMRRRRAVRPMLATA